MKDEVADLLVLGFFIRFLYVSTDRRILLLRSPLLQVAQLVRDEAKTDELLGRGRSRGISRIGFLI